MRDDKGFTLAEVLASLFVISAGAVATQGIVSGLIGHWSRAEKLRDHADRLLSQAEEVHAFETAIKSNTSERLYLEGPDPDQSTLILAAPQIDQSPDCRFDLVGRRCR